MPRHLFVWIKTMAETHKGHSPAAPDEPLVDIFFTNETSRQKSIVGFATCGAACPFNRAELFNQRVSRGDTTTPFFAILVETNLIRLWSINTVKPYCRPRYHNSIGVRDCRNALKVGSARCIQKEYCKKEYQNCLHEESRRKVKLKRKTDSRF